MELSVCFTVYNQINLLKMQLDKIHLSKNEHIEIIISDDCSNDKIKECVESYNDIRFKYFRTPHNLGHDLNILHAISCASYNYVAVFRTRDTIVCENIDRILEEINSNKEAGYFLFSAVDNGRIRLNFTNKIYNRQEDRLFAQYYLPEHPSGNIYNKQYLNLELYKKYIETYFDNIYGFTIHVIMRCDLSQKASLVTSSTVGWEYADTLKATDIAVNSTKNGINVYAPEYSIPRFRCVFNFIKYEVNVLKIEYLKKSIKDSYSFIIGRSVTLSNDKRYYSHYSSKGKKYNRNEIARSLDATLIELVSNLDEETKCELIDYSKVIKFHYMYIYPVKEFIRNLLLNSFVYDFFRSLVSKRKI